MAKFCALWLPLVVLCLFISSCEPAVVEEPLAVEGSDGGDAAPSGDSEDPATQNKEQDKFAKDELLKKDEYAEAKEWLASNDEKHRLWFKVDRLVATKLVDDLYRAGAAKVYACFGEKDEDQVEMVATFVAELPQDVATRKKVIDLHNKFWKKYLEDEEAHEIKMFLVTDTGQQYLVLNLDL